jgi:hypothetical protein
MAANVTKHSPLYRFIADGGTNGAIKANGIEATKRRRSKSRRSRERNSSSEQRAAAAASSTQTLLFGGT